MASQWTLSRGRLTASGTAAAAEAAPTPPVAFLLASGSTADKASLEGRLIPTTIGPG